MALVYTVGAIKAGFFQIYSSALLVIPCCSKCVALANYKFRDEHSSLEILSDKRTLIVCRFVAHTHTHMDVLYDPAVNVTCSDAFAVKCSDRMQIDVPSQFSFIRSNLVRKPLLVNKMAMWLTGMNSRLWKYWWAYWIERLLETRSYFQLRNAAIFPKSFVFLFIHEASDQHNNIKWKWCIRCM